MLPALAALTALTTIAAGPGPDCVAVLGTADLHGALEARVGGVGPDGNRGSRGTAQADGATKGPQVRAGGLPVVAAYVEILRRRYGERIVLLDGGDLYQGTLASNMSLGRAVIEGYGMLGYHGSAVGNHEFDFGPLTPDDPDRLGTFRARVAEASFPFLTLNVFEASTHQPVAWPGSRPSILVDAGGVKVGVVGVATVETPKVTRTVNVVSLEFPDPVPLIIAEARRLRAAGAQLVVLTGHIGGRCRSFDDPRDTSSCSDDSELFDVLRAMPPGTVDVALGGHTHAFVRHVVRETLVLQSGANGTYLSWADVCVAPGGGVDLERSVMHPAVAMCLDTWEDGGCEERAFDQGGRAGVARIVPATFLGEPVVPPAKVVAALQPYLDAAAERVARRVGVHLEKALVRNSGDPELGSLVAEAARAVAGADFGIQNLGGVRADLEAGEVRYGQVFQVLPFDNFVGVLHLHGRQVRAFIEQLVSRRGEPPYLAGIVASARLSSIGGYDLRDAAGRPLDDDASYTVATSDFLMGGGEGLDKILAGVAPENQIILETSLREALVVLLQRRFPGEGVGAGPAASR